MTAILFAKDVTTNDGTPAPKRDRDANSYVPTAKLDRHHERKIAVRRAAIKAAARAVLPRSAARRRPGTGAGDSPGPARPSRPAPGAGSADRRRSESPGGRPAPAARSAPAESPAPPR